MKIKWKGAVEEQPSCERKLRSHRCEFRRHLKHKKWSILWMSAAVRHGSDQIILFNLENWLNKKSVRWLNILTTSRPGPVSSHDLVLCEFHKRFILFWEEKKMNVRMCAADANTTWGRGLTLHPHQVFLFSRENDVRPRWHTRFLQASVVTLKQPNRKMAISPLVRPLSSWQTLKLCVSIGWDCGLAAY